MSDEGSVWKYQNTLFLKKAFISLGMNTKLFWSLLIFLKLQSSSTQNGWFIEKYLNSMFEVSFDSILQKMYGIIVFETEKKIERLQWPIRLEASSLS